VLWQFIKDQSFPSDLSAGPVPPAHDRVVLHLYCALHSSLGSICKGIVHSVLRLSIFTSIVIVLFHKKS
jgi:hypothetical protein